MAETVDRTDIRSGPGPRVRTGIAGLDYVLGGGLVPGRFYLVDGPPGSGKTTLALQFLLEGVARGEPGLYITLSETADELKAVAAAHGWSLDRLSIFELASAEGRLARDHEVTLLHPWEMELGETTQAMLREIERCAPARVVLDGFSEIRLLAQDALRYRREILALKQHFAGRSCTVLTLNDGLSPGDDPQLQSVMYGVIFLEKRLQEFGTERRRLRVLKMREAPFRGGHHDFVIRTGGLVVFPRLVAAEHPEHYKPFVGEPLRSGIGGLDALLEGGPLYGTATILIGPAGSGKSTLTMQWVLAAAKQGGNSAVYVFDERLGTLLGRVAQLGMDLRPFIDAGRIALEQIDPAELSPGEFVHKVRYQVENRGARIVVIDTLNGYFNAVPEERALVLQLHELLSYLNRQGVATFLILAQHGLIGQVSSPLDLSYMSDTVLLLRFFETEGRVRKCLAVVKNRGGGHEDTIRELRIGRTGIEIGEPLTAFRGILTGTPAYPGATDPLLSNGDGGGRHGGNIPI